MLTRCLVMFLIINILICEANASSPTVASDALQINDNLKLLYSRISSEDLAKDEISECISDLIGDNDVMGLKELAALDERVSALEITIGGKRLKKDVTEARAVAWLYGNAAFSKLVEIVSENGSDDYLRGRLLIGKDSPFALLLKIYQDIRIGVNNDDEPLRMILANESTYQHLINRDGWPRVKDAAGNTRSVIPLSKNIVGVPNAKPKRTNEIYSIWALINLQLDSWNNLAAVPKNGKQELPWNHNGQEHLTLLSLRSWVTEVKTTPALMAFNRSNSSDGTQLQDALSKIEAFLRFRENVSDAAYLESLIQKVALLHTPNPRQSIDSELKNPSKELSDLLFAARPLANGEKLYDAGDWLKYILVLSYRNQRALLSDSTSEMGFDRIWQKMLPGESFRTPTTHVRRSLTGVPFLRWNQPPVLGHVSSILNDISVAAIEYLKTQNQIKNLDNEHFDVTMNSGYPDYSNSYSYGNKLDICITNIRKAFLSRLLPYFSPGKMLNEENNVVLRNLLSEKSVSLTVDQTWPFARTFNQTAASLEAIRITKDLSAITKEISDYILSLEFAHEAYTAKDPQIALAAFNTPMPGVSSPMIIHSLPSKSFSQYKKDLDDQIEKLTKEIQEANAQVELKDNFEEMKKTLEERQTRLLISRLGRGIADKALAASRVFQEIAVIDSEIASLENKIKALELDGYSDQKEAAGIKIAYATQMRDLAAARVKGLEIASTRVEEIIKQADKDLSNFAQSLKDSAKNIQDQREKERAFGILKAVTNVVGAVLAPFTGGASLAIAGLVTNGINFYQSADKGNWLEAVQVVATVESSHDIFVNNKVNITALVGSNITNTIANVQAYVTSKIDSTKFTAISGDANILIQTLKGMDPHKMQAVASAIANGFMIGIKSNTLEIEAGENKIRFNNIVLQKALTGIFEAGGIVVNDATNRKEYLTKLLENNNEYVKQNLPVILEKIILPLPDEFIKNIGSSQANVKKRINQEIGNIKQALADNVIDAKTVKLFTQTLASGMAFVIDGEGIVAVERPLDKEALHFQRRLSDYENSVKSGSINTVITKLETMRNDLRDKAERFSKEQDDEKLLSLANNIANNIIPNQIAKELANLQATLEEARNSLVDKETEKKIVNYEADAVQKFHKAAGIKVEEAGKYIVKAEMLSKQAKLLVELGLLQQEQADTSIAADRLAIDVAELRFKHAYDKLISKGLDPVSFERVTDTTGTLREVVFGQGKRADIMRQMYSDRVVENLVGMIQWAEILQVKPIGLPKTAFFGKSVADWYAEVIAASASVELDIKKLRSYADDLEAIFGKSQAKATPEFAAANNITLEKIFWANRMSPVERERAFLSIPEKYRREILGTFTLKFNHSRLSDAENRRYAGVHIPSLAMDGACYIDISEIYIIAEEANNLTFLVIPPPTPIAHPAHLMTRGSIRPTRPIVVPKAIDTDSNDIPIKQQFEQKLGLWTDLNLSGAAGDWKFFILASGIKSEAERESEIQQLAIKKFKLNKVRLPYLQVNTDLGLN